MRREGARAADDCAKQLAQEGRKVSNGGAGFLAYE